MFCVKVSRNVSLRAYGSIELTSPAFAHLNVLASANDAMESPAQTIVAKATERRKENVIGKPPMVQPAWPSLPACISGPEIALP
jgi:hypothetical protein